MDLQSLKIERRQPPLRRRGNPWPVRGLVLGLLGGAGWLFLPALLTFIDRVRLPLVRRYVVTEAAAAATAAVRGTAANGYIVAARRAALSSDVPGRIVEMAVREGSTVKQGDIVARLFADEYRAALLRAEADFGTAQSQVLRTQAATRSASADVTQAESGAATAAAQRREGEALLAWAAAELARAIEMVASGASSTRDVERATSERDAQAARLAALRAAETTAAAAVAVAKTRVATAEADVAVGLAQQVAASASRDLAKATLDKTDVRAPFDGIVVLKDAEVGEVVSPNSVGGGNARGAVCTLVDFASLEVQANVPETTLSSVAIDAGVDVFLDAFPDVRFEGRVDRIWPTADRQKATVEVRIKLQQLDARLRPEMGARIVFRSDQATPLASGAPVPKRIIVPETTIVQIDGQSGAFVLERDVVRFAIVTTGERKNGRVVIETGLTAEQSLVLDPPPTLQSGDRVRIQDS